MHINVMPIERFRLAILYESISMFNVILMGRNREGNLNIHM
jgi:hypothetical protein